MLRRSLPSMNALFTFEAAARCGNFSRAADELNVTPAAVSRMVARLEDRLGTPLFVRLPNGVLTTEAGKLLFDATARGFSGIEATIREIQDRSAGTETVSLSVSTGFTTHWMMPRMERFKAAFPGVDLRFQLIMSALSGPVSDVDLGMRFVEGADDRHEATLVMPELLLPICSPAYLERHGDGHGTLKATATTIVNLSDSNTGWGDAISRSFGDGSNTLVFSDYAIVVQAALLGQGVALGWLNVVSHWLVMGDLVPARNDLIATGRRCHLVRQRDKPFRPVVTQIRDWIVAELADDLTRVDTRYPGLGLAAALTRPA